MHRKKTFCCCLKKNKYLLPHVEYFLNDVKNISFSKYGAKDVGIFTNYRNHIILTN